MGSGYSKANNSLNERIQVAKKIATKMGFSEGNYKQFLRRTGVEGYERYQGEEYTLNELKRTLRNIK